MEPAPVYPRVATLLAQHPWSVHPDRFVVVGLEPRLQRLALQLLVNTQASFFQCVVEPQEVTLVLPEHIWRELEPAFPHAREQLSFRLLQFNHDLPDDLVGFMAVVADALAQAGVPLLAVCSFSRDSLLVREDDLPTAIQALEQLSTFHQ